MRICELRIGEETSNVQVSNPVETSPYDLVDIRSELAATHDRLLVLRCGVRGKCQVEA